ncbi:YgiT-type zinc finger protein [bacterium]|nr:YgiT-type zinc finger protein [bacterium]
MKCSIAGCPGEYEAGTIVHTVERRGRVVVIDHVPAEVCAVCGDVLLGPDTVRHIEALLIQEKQPARTAPVYEYA